MRPIAQTTLKPVDSEAVSRAAALLRSRFPISQVVLFGSKARGDDDAESDIDLLVLTTRKLDWKQRQAIINCLYGLELELRVVASVLIVSEEDWHEGVYQVLPIREEIERDGVAA